MVYSTVPVPFLLFGPPGTGKTTVVVEALAQILKREVTLKESNVRILVYTPSNSASDLVVQRLSKIGLNAREILRLNSFSRPREFVPPDVLPYCCYSEDSEAFYYPKMEELQQFRLVVGTPFAAAKLYNLGIQEDHFTHLVVDEASQMVETDIVAFFAALSPSARARLFLAGDPKQLGPILRSRVMEKILGTTLQERLLKNPLYARKGK